MTTIPERRKNPPTQAEIEAAEHQKLVMAAHGKLIDLQNQLQECGTDYDKYNSIMDAIREAGFEYAELLRGAK